MAFMDLLMVAAMPPMQVLLIAVLGAFIATELCGILTLEARNHLNKVVFYVFTPALTFGCLAKTITLDEIISLWFMPVNVAMTFLIGSILGWMVVKVLRPEPHLKGLILAACSAGNLGALMVVIIPAICDQDTGLFGEAATCRDRALSYASFSMAFGVTYIWTYTYNLLRGSMMLHKKHFSIEEGSAKLSNNDPDASVTCHLLRNEDEEAKDITREQIIVQCSSDEYPSRMKPNIWDKTRGLIHHVAQKLLTPPTCSAVAGLVVGATPWLKSLIIGSDAPLRVIEDSITLVGDGTIPSVTLILGASLTKGMKKASMRKSIVIAVIVIRYVVLPLIGIGIVKGAIEFNLLPQDPLFRYTLLVQYTVPPAVNIGTMVELFNAGQEECSVIFLWTYTAAAFALTGWSTVYLWILSNGW